MLHPHCAQHRMKEERTIATRLFWVCLCYQVLFPGAAPPPLVGVGRPASTAPRHRPRVARLVFMLGKWNGLTEILWKWKCKNISPPATRTQTCNIHNVVTTCLVIFLGPINWWSPFASFEWLSLSIIMYSNALHRHVFQCSQQPSCINAAVINCIQLPHLHHKCDDTD